MTRKGPPSAGRIPATAPRYPLWGETGPLEAERILHENAFIFHEAAAIEKDPEKARLYRLAGHLTKIALQQNRKREAAPLKHTDKRIPGTPSSLVLSTEHEHISSNYAVSAVYLCRLIAN